MQSVDIYLAEGENKVKSESNTGTVEMSVSKDCLVSGNWS